MTRNLFATHIPLLARAFDLSEGDILEMGTGYFSTLLLDWLCSISGRKMVSYETNRRWYERAKKYNSDYHEVIFIENWDIAPIDNHQWGLAFIDHGPNGRRHIDIARLKDCADYIVVHDTEEERDDKYHYSKIRGIFKHCYDYTKILPNTSVFSNKYEFRP